MRVFFLRFLNHASIVEGVYRQRLPLEKLELKKFHYEEECVAQIKGI